MTDFTTAITVRADAERAFDAILSPRDWWGRDIEGSTTSPGDIWTYRYKDLHASTQQNAELVRGKRVVWDVIACRLSFLTDTAEWTGTKLVFEITPKGDATEIRFTHVGLVPQVECFEVCKNGWTGLIQDSLREFIETGTGLPDTIENDAA